MSDLAEKLDGITGLITKQREEWERQLNERDERNQKNIDRISEDSEAMRAEIERVGKAIEERKLSLPGSEEGKERFSVQRLIRGIHKGNVEKYAPHEWNIHQETLKRNSEEIERRMSAGGGGERAMTTLNDTTGGFLIPDEIVATFYNNFRAMTVREKLGVTELRPMGYCVKANKKTSNTTAYRHAEAATFSASEIALGQVSLTPKAVSARVVISEENLMFADPSIDGLVERDMIETIGLKMDLDMLEGAGGSSTPIGVLNTTGITNLSLNSGTGAALIWEDIIELEYALEAANALVDDGTLGFCSHPGVFKNLRKQRVGGSTTTDGPYMLAPGQRLADILTYKYATTTQLSNGADANSKPIFFARWSDGLHAQWGGMLVKRSNVATDGTYNGLTQNVVHIAVTMWDDFNVIRPASFTYTNDAKHN